MNRWLAFVVVMVSFGAGAEDVGDVSLGNYEATWESLDRHRTPEWFKDAKFGIFLYAPHPTASYWKEYQTARGTPEKEYSEASFGYRSVDKLTWDPDRIAKFIEEVGARYIVWSADSASHFLLHPSRYTDIPGSPFTYVTGPGTGQIDYTGEMAKAVRARGLKFGIYRNYLHPEESPYFLETMFEMIDKYQPSTLWLDEKKFSYPTEILKGRELLAYYYNHSKDPDNVACEDALGSYKRPTIGKSLVHGDWYRREAGHSPPADEISDGAYARYERFRPHEVYRRSPVKASDNSIENFIHWLAHTASHGGNLEIAMDSTSDEVFEWYREQLLPMGAWLKQNGEAIYQTRPWVDGMTKTETASGIPVRFTRRGDALYAILLARPPNEFALPKMRAHGGTTVRLLGFDGDLKWVNSGEGLVIRNPSAPLPGEHSFVYKIDPIE